MRKKNSIRFLVLCGALWMSAGSVWAADLKLNPDTLMKARDNYENGDIITRADELFIGVGDESFTFADMENCLKRYGLDYHRMSDADSDGFFMYGLYFGACMDEAIVEEQGRLWENYDGSGTKEDPQWVQIMNQQENILYQAHLNKDTEFIVNFRSDYNEATDESITYPVSAADELIERVAIINHGDYTLKNGWVWEENAWRYYENDAMVTGFKWIDGQLYCFEENGFMIHDCFREIAGNKYHFNENWADRGWQTLTENGETSWYYFSMEDAHAMKGYVNGIEGDGFKYFFWQDGFTDQNGKAYPAGALAQGTDGADLWVCQNGIPLYLVDKNGHLYINMEDELNGSVYVIDEMGNVTPKNTNIKQYLGNDLSKNYKGNNYSDFVVVSGFEASDVRKQHNDVTCTAYSDLLIGKITKKIGHNIEFSNVENEIWGAGGAKWAYSDSIFNSKEWDANRRMREIYERVMVGTPVIVRCGGHSVVAVGVRQDAKADAIKTSDILIADSARGQVMTLEELNDTGYDINKPDAAWFLLVPDNADRRALTTY